ncbi:hypothetical protein FRC09_004440 [Ceratobasidium sp. 395]|nr:hypothetical protein FRC09_004440 [Ceratobasidium sp. 395]
MPPITSYFSRATPEQAAEQSARGFEEIRHSIQWQKARKLTEDGAKAERQREAATERQKRRRQQLKEAEIKLGLRHPGTLRKIKPVVLRDSSPNLPVLPPPANLDGDTEKKAVPRRKRRRRAPRTN